MTKQFIPILFLAVVSSCVQKNKETKFDPEAVNLEVKAFNLMQAGKNDSALILLDKAIQIDSSYYIAYGLKADIYFQLNDTAKGLTELENQLKAAPDLAEGWTMTAMIYDRRGDSLKAHDYYKKSIELYSNRISNPDTTKKGDYVRSNRLNRAISMILYGQDEDGRNEFFRLKKEDPNNLDSTIINSLINKSRREILNEYTR